MYAAIATIIIAILTPFVTLLVNRKNTASDYVDPPHRERWLDRVRKFKDSIRS